MNVDKRVPAEWKLLLSYDEIMVGVRKCAQVLDQQFQGKELVMVCILKGAVPFFVDLTREMQVEHGCYYIESSSYHNAQQQSRCDITVTIEPSKFKGKYVGLIDEMHDGGKTLFEVKKAIMTTAEVSADKIFTCTIFKKDKPTVYPPPDFFAFKLPDVWCNGYGLDHMQKLRNLKNLYAAPKNDGIPKSEADKLFDDEEYYTKVRQELMEQIESLKH